MSNKYGAVPCEADGYKFASHRERDRYFVLKTRQELGEISDLRLQVTYKCVVNDIHVCDYRADFVYNVVATGCSVTEDAKGYRTREFLLKCRLILALYKITILET